MSLARSTLRFALIEGETTHDDTAEQPNVQSAHITTCTQSLRFPVNPLWHAKRHDARKEVKKKVSAGRGKLLFGNGTKSPAVSREAQGNTIKQFKG